jgi:tetratricopeptide (TPR) repeat protein
MKMGRNSPCPCGSGKKFKNCCGATRETLTKDPPGSELAYLAQAMGGHAHLSAETRARELLQLYPRSGILWKFLGISLAMQEKAALESLEMAARLLPEDADAHFNYGHALRGQRRLEEARVSYARAVELRPEFGYAHIHLGATQKELGHLEAAVRSYSRGLNFVPRSAAAHSNLGGALHELGRLHQAVESYSKALDIDPLLAETHGNLGAALLALGQAEKAAISLERALTLDPNFALAHLNFGNALQQLGRVSEAAASYRRCIRIEPQLAAAYTNLGNAQRELGQSDDALASHRHALAIDPSLAVAHRNLATTLQELGQITEAESSLRRALELNPQAAEVHNNLAVILHSQNRMVEAEAFCLKALEMDPDLTSALALRAELEADKGHFPEAGALYRRATSIDPNFAQAWAGLAGLRKMTPDDALWLQEAQRVVGNRLPLREEIQLRYAIGKYFDDLRDYPAAFTNFQRANELTKQITPRYDAVKWEKQFKVTADFYEMRRIAELRPGAEVSERPVFIVGMPRSGTSLVEQILASLPSVHGAGELPFWTIAAAAYESAEADTNKRAAMRREFASSYLGLLEGLSSDAQRVTDKMPANFLVLGLIHSIFPNSRIIYMRRNPVDTCLSIYFQNFGVSHSYANDLKDLTHFYAQHSRLMGHWMSVLPKHAILEVPYEDLIENQELWSRKMLEFIGLPWDPRCLEFSETNRVVATRSRWQVRQKIDKSSVERWRNYESFVGPLRTLLEQDHQSRQGQCRV